MEVKVGAAKEREKESPAKVGAAKEKAGCTSSISGQAVDPKDQIGDGRAAMMIGTKEGSGR